jgi:hypothetical protein
MVANPDKSRGPEGGDFLAPVVAETDPGARLENLVVGDPDGAYERLTGIDHSPAAFDEKAVVDGMTDLLFVDGIANDTLIRTPFGGHFRNP